MNGNNTNTSNSISTGTSSGSGSGKNSLTASATNAQELLSKNGSEIQSQTQAQLLECLEKLDLILANQKRFEAQLAAQGIIVSVGQAENTSSINA